jgi:glycosyltransferase involved in cell wall biosynthesis
VPVLIGSVRNVGTWMGPARRFVERASTAFADAVIVNAPAVGRYMIDVVGVRADRLRLIPNGVDTSTFRPRRDGDPDLRTAIWGGEPAEVVGCVMSLTEKKNPRMLVEAARRVVEARPSARFLLAGEGPLRGSIEAAIASSGLSGRFRLLGFRNDTPDLIRSFDVLALTSDREGLPNIVLEAMATGIPVVATGVGGAVDLVREDETGRIVPPGDAGALAEALLGIIRDREAARRMGEAARRIVLTEFAMERMVERTMGLYDELLSRGANERVPRPAGAAERSPEVPG